LIKYKYLFFSIAISLVSYFATLYYGKFYYDGHHYGLVYDDAINILSGSKPFKEIFFLYGFFSTIVNSIALKIFGYEVISLLKISSIFYSLSFILIYLISNKFLENYLSFFLVLFIFFIHPVVIYPWSNYLLFFLILVSVLFFLSKSKLIFYFSALFFALSSITREGIFIYVILSITFFLFLIFLSKNKSLKKKYNKKKILNFFALFFCIILIFIIYLYESNLLNDFYLHLKIPIVFLEFKDITLINLYLNLFRYLFIEGVKNIITETYVFLFALMFLSNIIYLAYIFFFILKKKPLILRDIEIVFISIISLFLFSLSINEINIFRLICGASLGFIVLFYIVHFKIKDKFLSKYLTYSLVILSFSSLSLFKKNNSNIIYKTGSEMDNSIYLNLNNFKENKFDKETFFNLRSANEIFSQIKNKNNCQIKYFVNLQRDIFFRIIAKEYFYTFQKLPWYSNGITEKILVKYYDNEFADNLERSIKNKNVIIIVDSQKNYADFYDKKVYFNGYKIFYKFPYSYHHKYLAILTPIDCN
jgi:hypothetical protein